MVKIITGNIFNSNADAIINTVNGRQDKQTSPYAEGFRL